MASIHPPIVPSMPAERKVSSSSFGGGGSPLLQSTTTISQNASNRIIGTSSENHEDGAGQNINQEHPRRIEYTTSNHGSSGNNSGQDEKVALTVNGHVIAAKPTRGRPKLGAGRGRPKKKKEEEDYCTNDGDRSNLVR